MNESLVRLDQIQALIQILLNEMPEYRPFAEQYSGNLEEQRRLLRSLMNLRSPSPVLPEFLKMQNALLKQESLEKGIVDVLTLKETGVPNVALWQGDITRLKADAIVNAANSALLGCFIPCHHCIDNAIHTAAGVELREECARLMLEQAHEEPVGRVKMTAGYNLPSRYVFHTVGPIVGGKLTDEHKKALKSCYTSCLQLAMKKKLKSIVFCCISTGEYHFPNIEAAKIAIDTVKDFVYLKGLETKVIFNVYQDIDKRIYNELLRTN